MNKSILAIIALVLIVGVGFFIFPAKDKNKTNAQPISAQELQDALNRQLAMLFPQDDELRIDGSFACNEKKEKLVCKAQKIAVIDTMSDTELASLQNLTLDYLITHENYDSTISGDVSYGQALLEQIEFFNRGFIEALTPLLPNKFSCNTGGTLDSVQGIETNWGECTIVSPSADWIISGNMDIGFDLFKNATMPELILEDGKLGNLGELTEDNIDSVQIGLRQATLTLVSRNFSDALFEVIRLKEPNLTRGELALGVDMAIGMAIMAMRANEIDEEDMRTSEQFAQALEHLQAGLRGLLASDSDVTNISVSLQAKEPQKIMLYSPAMLEMGSVFEFLRHYNLESSYK